MPIETKRYKANLTDMKNRQLSGLFTIVSNHLLLAAELLGTECDIETIREVSALSSESRKLARELTDKDKGNLDEDLVERMTILKYKILELLSNLSYMLSKIDKNKNGGKTIKDLIFVRKLLRESQRGLATVQSRV